LDVKIVVVEISERLRGILGTAKVLTSRAKVLLLASSTSAQRDHRWWSVHRWFGSNAGISRDRGRGYILTRRVVIEVIGGAKVGLKTSAALAAS